MRQHHLASHDTINNPRRGWLCVVLHDVAPAHWSACKRVLRVLRAAEREAGVSLPLTLLVVPELDGVPFAPPRYLSGLQQLQHNGHELALHGLSHRDDGARPGPFGLHWVRPDSRGEFAALDTDQARARIAQGQAWAREQRLSVRGFVAPAGRLSEGAWQAVADAGFEYTCTRNEIVALPYGQALRAPSLVFDTGSAWRRGLSVLWNRAQAWQHGDAPLLRLDLHPQDADHRAVRHCWSALLATALRERRPLRLAQAAELARARASRALAVQKA